MRFTLEAPFLFHELVSLMPVSDNSPPRALFLDEIAPEHYVYASRIRYDGKNLRLNENFQLWEFQCKDGTDLVLWSPTLVSFLQALRDECGLPVGITSAYRTQKYNDNLKNSGGNSQHVRGRAVDHYVVGAAEWNPLRLAEWWHETLGVFFGAVGGIGYYPDNGFVHVDLRPGPPVRWRISGDNYTALSPTNPDWQS